MFTSQTFKLVLLSGLLVTISNAFDPNNLVLPTENSPFNGNGSRTTGIVNTYNIPLTNHPQTIHSIVRGGNGGNADAGPTFNRDRFQGKGGGGTLATATFSISSTAANSLRPGGEIRIIVGNRGAHMQGPPAGTQVAAGGGGGSGVLYKGPEVNADWMPLIIAGGGGGGLVNSFSTGVLRIDGGNGQVGPIGSTTVGVFPPPGYSGASYVNHGEGGAGWLRSAYYGAGKGQSSGGVGGLARYSGTGDRTSSGGFGCGGGGSAGGELGTCSNCRLHLHGGGGGGGYTGGGGGGMVDQSVAASGGGGSLIHFWAIDDQTQTIVQRAGGAQLNGYIEIQPSLTTIPNDNAKPAIFFNGGNPHNVAFSATDAFAEPGVSATDFYGNPIAVQEISNNVNRAVSGQYQVVYGATDQYGQTAQRTRTVNVLAGSLRPTFSLSPSLVVTTTGPQSHSVITNFDGGGGASEQLVRYEITGNSNPSLFSSDPGISNAGYVNFTLEENAVGSATLTVIAIDNGPDPSVVQSLPKQITIIPTIAPQPPQFILGTDPLEYGTSVEFREDAASLIVGTVFSVASASSPDLTYSLGGLDKDLFILGESDGVLTFKTRPNYNAPTDHGGDRIYNITVTASDGTSFIPTNLTVNLLAPPPPTFIVTNDANSGAGSLRQVIIQADNNAGHDVITFDPAFFNVPRTITLSGRDLVPKSSMTINGPGRDLLTINGNDLFRAFTVGPAVTLELNDLTMDHCASSVDIFIRPSTLIYPWEGGAIYNMGSVTLNRVTISNCHAFAPSIGIVISRGGAIFNRGNLTINDSILSNNTALGSTETDVSSSTRAEGGAIFNQYTGTVTINNSVLTENEARGVFSANVTAQPDNQVRGGAIFNLGTLTLDNTSLSSNISQALSDWTEGMTTRARGGAIYNDGSMNARNGCTFSGNIAYADTAGIGPGDAEGGAIFSYSGSSMSVEDSTFTGNKAESKNVTIGEVRGGALLYDSGNGLIRNCQFTGNEVTAISSLDAEAYGGAVYNQGALSILNSSLTNNSTTGTSAGNIGSAFGGGLYSSGPTTLSNSTIVGNSCSGTGPMARGIGGGIFTESGTLTMRNSTVALNKSNGQDTGMFAGASGGGLETGGFGTINIGNSIICGNSVTASTATFGPDLLGSVTSVGFNLIGNPTDTTGLIGSDLTGYTPCAIFLDANSDSVIDLADLQIYGGSTETLALLETGAATDAGSNALIPIDPATAAPFETDQRGSGFARIFNGTVDIGAFEFHPVPTLYDTWADSHGLTPGSNDGFTHDANNDGVPNIVHFAFDTDPLGSGSSEGKRRLDTTSFPDGEHLTITIPVRVGASFTGSPSPEATIDGIMYQIQGSTNLNDWSASVTEVTPAQSAGLPALRDIDGDTNPDWEYRTFTLKNDSLSGGFIRVGVEEYAQP